ncbi:hypothetical protein D3C81_1762190 [compost metagenome]
MPGNLPECGNRVRAFACILIGRFTRCEHHIRIISNLLDSALQFLQQHRTLLRLHRLLLRPHGNFLNGAENILIGMGGNGGGLLERVRIIRK